MIRVIVMVACTALTISAPAQPSERLLDAIRQVESGGREDLVGDGGRAIGPYQIHRAYWTDAVRADPRLGGKYEDCKREAYARRVVRAYLSHYGKGKTSEQLARMHNGGRAIFKRVGSAAWHRTTRYWQKVKVAMR